MKFINKTIAASAIGIVMACGFTSCEDGKSYSDLLRDEEVAVNWYLSNCRVKAAVPEDSVFEEGKDAPFYRMDRDGSVYMRVVRKGDMSNRPKKGDTVYYRYIVQNVINLFDGTATGDGYGNADMGVTTSQSFIYGNTVLESTVSQGTGIQVPLNYLGYDCEVDLIVKSISGPTSGISECQPYVYRNLKYFKAEY